MITKETAAAIWSAYEEIRRGEELGNHVTEVLAKHEQPNPNDPFDRRRIEMGVPTGDRSHRLLNVCPGLATSVIKAHIADKRAELAKLQEQARMEMDRDFEQQVF